jgi:hypothetical protein
MAIIARINTGGSIGRATISTPRNTTVVSQNFKPKPNVALGEIVDVSLSGLQDGDTITYNSTTGKFEANTVTATVTSVIGGTF